MDEKKFRILGIDFFRGSLEDAVAKANGGGLCVAPSGPGLAGDLTNCSVYSKSLTQADLVLPDSGLMCLWTKFFREDRSNEFPGWPFLRHIFSVRSFVLLTVQVTVLFGSCRMKNNAGRTESG